MHNRKLLKGYIFVILSAVLYGLMPLMTTFSVYNLARNNEFDCTKARTELGYTTRSYEETIHDEVQWMIAEGLIDSNGVVYENKHLTTAYQPEPAE